MDGLVFDRQGMIEESERRQMLFFRKQFLKLLTEDKDLHGRDFNQPLFHKEKGYPFSHIDLDMVMDKFDKALGIKE